MNTGKKVRVTKIKPSADPLFPLQTLEKHAHGELNVGYTLPVEYYVEGIMDKSPVVGESFTLLRNKRNGVEVSGVFTTSKVVKVTDDGFETLNSIYKVEYL